MVGWFAEVYRRKGLKVNAGKSKLMVLNGEEGLEHEVHLNFWGVFWTNQVQMEQCSRKVAGAIKSLVNARDFQL